MGRKAAAGKVRPAKPERTTKQVAERLGEKPTKLYHHVEALERVTAASRPVLGEYGLDR